MKDCLSNDALCFIVGQGLVTILCQNWVVFDVLSIRALPMCGFPNIGISRNLGFPAFLWISGRFLGGFHMPAGTWNPYILPAIPIFAQNPQKSAKFQFLGKPHGKASDVLLRSLLPEELIMFDEFFEFLKNFKLESGWDFGSFATSLK